MLDLSLGEILIVVIVAAIFIGPKEMPVVIRSIAGFLRSLKNLAGEIRAAFDEVAEESGFRDEEIRLIKGDDGKMYESYDLPVNLQERDHGT